ncbi:flagellar protein FlaG [Halalkalibacterium halodurans]|uniref:flagellar protein FlaG n=1 Tax=Halalkalibacterium halodurans TaxID=86665 RepID=UPI002E1EB722|nr:flagellar protein FlaG [Halalkalibacterium halodurans]
MEINLSKSQYAGQVGVQAVKTVAKVQGPAELEEYEPSKRDVQHKIDDINKVIETLNTGVRFALHEDLNEYYVTIVDKITNEVVKEIPPKKLLDIYAAMKETVSVFFDKKI